MPTPVYVPAGKSTLSVGSAASFLVVPTDSELVAVCLAVLHEVPDTLTDLDSRSKSELLLATTYPWNYNIKDTDATPDESAGMLQARPDTPWRTSFADSTERSEILPFVIPYRCAERRTF